MVKEGETRERRSGIWGVKVGEGLFARMNAVAESLIWV